MSRVGQNHASLAIIGKQLRQKLAKLREWSECTGVLVGDDSLRVEQACLYRLMTFSPSIQGYWSSFPVTIRAPSFVPTLCRMQFFPV